MDLLACFFLGTSLFLSIIHLVFCFKLNETWRKITKVFCVGFLALSMMVFSFNYPLIYIGAFAGAIGDYFLIKKERLKSLMTGIVFFLIGHICYILQIMLLMNSPMWAYVLYVGVLMLCIILVQVFCYPKLKYLAHKLTNLGTGYFLCMSSSIILCIIYLIMGGGSNLTLLLILFGYILFVTSDSILMYTTYIKSWKRADFYIMITYLFAQYLITFGLVLTTIHH